MFGPLSLLISQPTAKIIRQHQCQISKKSHVTHCTHLITVTNTPHHAPSPRTYAQDYCTTLFKATGGRFLWLKLSWSRYTPSHMNPTPLCFTSPRPPSSVICLFTYSEYKYSWLSENIKVKQMWSVSQFRKKSNSKPDLGITRLI